jgi:hypothetical protein
MRRWLWLIVLAGCGQDHDWIVTQGQVVTFYQERGLPLCAGNVPHLDRSAQAIAGYLGLPLPRTIPYYYMRDVNEHCENREAGGCTQDSPTIVWAKEPDTTHELVHAIQFNSGGYRLSLLSEGQAVALGEASFHATPEVAAPDADLLAGSQLPAKYYATAGDLVSFLLDRSGPTLFQRLIAGLPEDATIADVQAISQRVYGASFTELRRRRAMDPVVYEWNRLGMPECMGPVPPSLPPEGAPLAEDVSCASNAVAAGTERPWMSWGAGFQLETDGLFAFSPNAPQKGNVLLRRCGPGGGTVSYGERGDLRPGAQVVAFLPAGRYHYSFGIAQTDAAASFAAGLTRLPAPTAVECPASLPHLDLAPETQYLSLAALGPRTVEVAFSVDRPRKITATVLLGSSAAAVCAPACAGACQPLGLFQHAELSPGVTYSVRAQLDGRSPPVTLQLY